jgi:hypothetical protein
MPASQSKLIVPFAIVAIIAVAVAVGFFVFSGSGAPSGKIVEFVNKPVGLAEDVDSLESPQESAAVVAHLPKGMSVDVVGIADGRKWAQVTLPDKRTAYVPARLVQPSAGQIPVASPVPPVTDPAATAQFVDDQAKRIEFDPTSDVYRPQQSVRVFVEPDTHAPEKYEVDAGTGIPAIARSRDGAWIMASTDDGSPAFLQTADLGPPHAGKVVPASLTAPQLPDIVEGAAKVNTTSSLDVGGQPVMLFGIEGEGGEYADKLQSIIDRQGGSLRCERRDQQYVCKTSGGLDIAMSALYYGGARPTSDSPQNYQEQAGAAQSKGLGIWAAAKQ